MTRLEKLFATKQKDVLNIYFTAGFPDLKDTARIVLALDKAGADVLEIGMPYSDPLADGPTIQESGSKALKNGMKLQVLFDQLESIRERTEIPIVLMGYFNQVMQYGEEKFFAACKRVGVDGLILPDLPLEVFAREYQDLYRKFNLDSIFIISPHSQEERIRRVNELSTGFVYMVADASITGGAKQISDQQIAYFDRIEKLKLDTPRLIGFGISDNDSFTKACEYANGAIIGSAFIRHLEKDSSEKGVREFISNIRG